MTGYTGAEIAEAHRRWEQLKRFERASITHRLDEIRRDQVEGIRARRPGGLESYQTRADMRAAQNLASARKRRDRRGGKHRRPAPRGVIWVSSGVGFPLTMPNYGRAMEGLARAFRQFSVAAIAATDAFSDIRERVALQQCRDGATAGLEIEDEMAGLGNEPILEQRDDTRGWENTTIVRETLLDVMQREC